MTAFKLLLTLPVALVLVYFSGCHLLETGSYIVAGEWREGAVVASYPCETYVCEGPYASSAIVEYPDGEGGTGILLVPGRYETGESVRVLTSSLHDSAVKGWADVVGGVLGAGFFMFLGLGFAAFCLPERRGRATTPDDVAAPD